MLLDDQDLFGSMRGEVLSDCNEELDEVFGETNTERNYELLWQGCLFFIFSF